MLSAAETLALILSKAPLLPAEHVPLADALHRLLREDARADLDMPPFDCSAVDGYAIAGGETLFEIVDKIQAGSAAKVPLAPGQCARIYTGAPIPAGAERVLMQEEVRVEGGHIRAPIAGTGTNIRRRGENCARGDVVVAVGQCLNPSSLAALAGCGITEPLVTRLPRVVHLVTGDELVDPACKPQGAQIRDTNSTLIAALLAAQGGQLVFYSRVPDRFENAMECASHLERIDFDILLISGGASVGDHDYAKPMLEKAGFTIHLQQTNIRPGKPLVFASRGRQFAFGLPGNPVSHSVIFQLFIVPLFFAMSGSASVQTAAIRGRLESDLPLRPIPRETFWPSYAHWDERGFVVRPLRFQSSGDAAGIAGANGLMRLPPWQGPLKKDDSVNFLLSAGFL